jgi:transposase
MGAPMDRTRIDEGVRRMRFESLLDRHERGEITQAEAAEMLGVAERTFRRWLARDCLLRGVPEQFQRDADPKVENAFAISEP